MVEESKKSGGGGRLVVAIVSLLCSTAALVGVLAFGLENPKLKHAVLTFLPNDVRVKVGEVFGVDTGFGGYKRNLEDRKEQDFVPEYDFAFTLHWNGDGIGGGLAVNTKDWRNGMDDMIRKLCPTIEGVRSMGKNDPQQIQRICEPNTGARLFDQHGVRIYSFNDLRSGIRTYIVPQGVHFVWPLGKVGQYHYPHAIEHPVEDAPIRLKQLSMSPRVFTVENFMSKEEMDAILNHNRELVKPSEVGFAGWRDSTRTSSTAWDFHSWAAKKIQRRSFDLLSMDFHSEMADALQVLRYNVSEWYKPHTDWFDEKAYDGHDPTVNNGTNRFATVFLYLNNVEEGGHTVFPLSTTHEGYHGEQLVHPGTENTPGYIAQRDAEWVCNTSSTALRSNPKAGTAVLFYSQGPEGALDKYSLHGGCPVIKGIKWSANVWVWSNLKPSKDAAKDGKPQKNENAINMQFHNKRDESVDLYWDDGTDEMVHQLTIEPGMYSPMTTYHSHRFVFKSKSGGDKLGEFVANDNKHKDVEHVEEIN